MVLMIELETKEKVKKSIEDKGDMPFESSDDNDNFIDVNGSVVTIKSSKSTQENGADIKAKPWRSHLTLLALLLANLHNNMDKYTIASKSHDQQFSAQRKRGLLCG